jgi:adenosylcobyric acid synthase
MRAKALMVLGTGSHVGKSLLTAALCRILVQEGYRVAPFKAQNMSLNSAATPEGLEIGRAQAMQADAARIPPSVHMNPVLLKPSSDTSSQLIVRGRVWGQVGASDYHRARVNELFPIVVDSYHRLAIGHDVVVLEGAGSPAEINLQSMDIVNMRMADAADAACLLVGDIDRGGVFASLLGTLALLDEAARARVRGFLVNKFRGDVALLWPGVESLEARVGKPCVGVVPFLHDVGLEEEDSVTLGEPRTPAPGWGDYGGAVRPLRVAVIALPYLANFTDFDPLAAEPSVAVAYVRSPPELRRADLVILPGTKQTIADFRWLEESGLSKAIEANAVGGGPIVGICGGMQMLGLAILDPHGMEGGGGAAGLGLLPIRTVLADEKTMLRARGWLAEPRLFGQGMEHSQVEGYEIHLGETAYEPGSTPLFRLMREGEGSPRADGAVADGGRILGTYLHGLFDSDAFRHSFLRAARAACGLEPPRELVWFSAEREARFDRLASHVRASVRLEQILAWLGLERPRRLRVGVEA